MITIPHTNGVISEEEIENIPEKYVSKHSDGSNWLFFETQQEIDDYFPPVVPIEDDPLYLISQAYLQYEREGVEYFRKKRSQIVYLYQTEELTEQEVYDIEAKLKEVKGLIISGDWMSGLNAIASTTVSGAYTQELKDEITAEINDYITNNY